MKTRSKLFVRSWAVLALTLIGTAGSYAQTKVNLRDQSSVIDFSTAVFTRPVKTGTVMPAQCETGDLFFKTNATAGQNLFACTATNTWTQLAGQSLPSVSGSEGRVLSVNGGNPAWTSLGGDITGSPAAVNVTKIQNRAISSAAPAPGMALVWNGVTSQWEPQAIAGGSGGALTIQNDGVSAGSRGALNWVPGVGLTYAIQDTGSAIQIQQSIDTAVVQTRANAQSGASVYCASESANGSNYTCFLHPALSSYTAGMVVNWRVDVSGAGGPTTLNIDTLGPKPVRTADGLSDPAPGDLVADHMYSLWYDGNVFRLPAISTSPAANIGDSGAGGSGGGSSPAPLVEKDGPYLKIGDASYLMPGMYQVTKPSAVTWADSSSGGTWSDLAGGAMVLNAPSAGGNAWRIRHTNRNGATTITYALQCLTHADGTGNARCGIFLRDSNSGRLMMVEFARQEYNGATTVQGGCWTSPTAYSGSGLFNGTVLPLSHSQSYAQFVFNANNTVSLRFSHSGLDGTWLQLATWNQTACGMPAPPDQAGVAAYATNHANSGSPVLTLLSFKAE